MARRRKGLPVNGWINLDKPLHLTSSDAVGRIKRLFNANKVGHAGTLDPLATGILPIALGEATKTVPFVQDSRKLYSVTVRWGEARDTDDCEGAVIASSDRRPTVAEIEALIPRFLGRIDQVPPIYSALKVAGDRAYDLARAGEAVTLDARPVMVYDLQIRAQLDAEHAVFMVTSGRGFYVRALARDLGQALGCHGHVAALCREAVGPFALSRSVSLAALEADGVEPSAFLLPVETALDDIPALALTEEEAIRLRNGQPVALLRRHDRLRLESLRAAGDGDTDPVALATAGGRPVALVRLEGAELRPFRVLNV